MERKKYSIFELMEEFRKRIEKIFEESFEYFFETPMYDIEKKELSPLYQITETEDEVIVTFDLPCVEKEDIKLKATEDYLRIEAPLRKCVRISPWGPIREEVEFSLFRKTIRLPSKVDHEKSRARFRDGILEVRFPKKITGFKIEIE
ncbi:MAG: Hsp20/alpha crystallin family protein [Candidatus Bathyarchaeia archaeon]